MSEPRRTRKRKLTTMRDGETIVLVEREDGNEQRVAVTLEELRAILAELEPTKQ